MGIFEMFKAPQETKKPIQQKPIEKKPVVLNPNLDQYNHPKVTFTEAEMVTRGLTANDAEKKAKIASNKIAMENPFEKFKREN